MKKEKWGYTKGDNKQKSLWTINLKNRWKNEGKQENRRYTNKEAIKDIVGVELIVKWRREAVQNEAVKKKAKVLLHRVGKEQEEEENKLRKKKCKSKQKTKRKKLPDKKIKWKGVRKSS